MWKLLGAEEDLLWDHLSGAASDDNPFQSEAWGRYKRQSGWEPQRWIAQTEEGRPLCAVQVLKKSLPLGRTILWAPGGPLIGFEGAAPETLEKLLPEGIRKICGANRAGYVRFYNFQPAAPEIRRFFSGLCAVPRKRLGSGTTVQIDLRPSLEELLARMDKKHRYQARQLDENGIAWSWGSSEEMLPVFGRLHAEMAALKKVPAANTEDLSRLVREFQGNARILTGSLGTEAVTSCLILLKGKNAFYWRAATNRKGREIFASYAMVLELLKQLKADGVERFDFGGILPGVPAAEGINHFKQGFGGSVVEYLGEWEWSDSAWLRWGVNAWLACRGES